MRRVAPTVRTLNTAVRVSAIAGARQMATAAPTPKPSGLTPQQQGFEPRPDAKKLNKVLIANRCVIVGHGE